MDRKRSNDAMLSLLTKLFSRQKPSVQPAQSAEAAPEADPIVTRNEIGLTLDMDAVSLEQPNRVYEELAKRNDAPLFTGEVEHAYSKAAVTNVSVCPRCHSPTERKCAHFIYATDIAPRVMFAPAGFFCTNCPTVIVDESIVAKGMKPGFQFHGVIGIDLDGENQPIPFDTWNGKKTIYLLDENDQILGLSTDLEPRHGQQGSSLRSPGARKKLKRKRHLAKRARQRNRRH